MALYRIAICWACALALGFFTASAQAPTAGAEEAAAEETVVIAESLGPGLWRVLGGPGEVHVFGVVRPLPKGMTWRSGRIDGIVARADRAILAESSITLGAGQAMRLLFTRRDAVRNPDDLSLWDYLPDASQNALDAALQTYGMQRDAVEDWRPYVAAGIISQKALEQAGLSDEVDPAAQIAKKLRRARVKPQKLAFGGDVEAILKRLNQMPIGADGPCLDQTLAILATETPALKDQAFAWAAGEVDAIRAVQRRLKGQACAVALEAGGVPVEALLAGFRTDLAAAIAAATAEPGVTLVVAPMGVLLSDEGVLALLEKQGLTIDGP